MMGDFFIGTRGWDFLSWDETFYPEDLPSEWRLSYYANEFNAVLLPAGIWSLADRDEIDSWVEDVHEAFRFFLELPVGEEEVSADRISAVVAGLGSACGGLLLLDSQLKAEQMSVDTFPPLYLALFDDAQPGVKGFHYLSTETEQQSKPDFLLVDDDPQLDLPAIRQLITLMASPGVVPYAQGLFLSGDGVSANKLQQLRMMTELMGIA